MVRCGRFYDPVDFYLPIKHLECIYNVRSCDFKPGLTYTGQTRNGLESRHCMLQGTLSKFYIHVD